MSEIKDRVFEGGEIYTVPVGLTVHCMQCSKKLEAGTKCYIEDDSSSIFCLTHIPAPKHHAPLVERTPFVPRRKQVLYD